MVAESGGGASGRADAAWPTAAITGSAARTLRRFLCTPLLVQVRPYAPCAGSVNAVESPPLRRLPTTKKPPGERGLSTCPPVTRRDIAGARFGPRGDARRVVQTEIHASLL